jgi:8-oxo-dGTP diphosphatase
MIDVCCAIIINGTKILAVQRGPESSHPKKWEFPGGKIQSGEKANQCIVREIDEELSVRIKILDQIEFIDFDYGHKQIRLIPFVCKISSGEIFLTEHISMHWFKFDEWNTIDWAGADQKLIIQNLESLRMLMEKQSGKIQ